MSSTSRIACVLVAVALAATAGASAQTARPADPNAAWSKACKTEIEKELAKERPTPREVAFDDDTLMRQEGPNNTIHLSGSGKFLGPGGTWRRFSYACTWDSTAARLTSAQATRDKGASEICQRAVEEKIRAERSDARELRMDAGSLEETAKGTRTDVSGTGQFSGGRGNERQFSFQCSVDAAAGKATSATWKIIEPAPPSPEPVEDSTAPSPEACRVAVQKELQRQRPNASAIQIFSESIETAAGASGLTTMTGRGQYDGGRGQSNGIRFECTFDDASGTVIRARYNHRG